MAVSISELIAQREEIQNKKRELYDLETSIGTLTVKQPTTPLILEISEMENVDSDRYLIFKCTIEPNLNDKDLQEAYDCLEPTDIVEKLFKPGEVRRLARAIMEAGGYEGNIVKKLHKEVKN